MLTLRELERAAASTGFSAASLEKVERLAEVLEELRADPGLADVLVLKGGTALNLLFDPSPRRLSVDLDFNFVGAEDRAGMLAARPGVERAVQAACRRLGYQVQTSADAFAGRKLYLGFRRVLDGLPDRIQVDLNFLHRLPLLPPIRREPWRPGGGASTPCQVLSFAEVAAGKICAAFGRAAPRDLWDVAQLERIGGSAWLTGDARGVVIAYAGSLDHALPSYAGRQREPLIEHLEQQLYPMLTAGERPRPEGLLRMARAALLPFLGLTPAEAEYCDRLQLGEILPTLLFPDRPDLAERLARFPPLLWKAENARGHRGALQGGGE